MSAGERLVVAQVRGFHGLRGAVRLESLTDRPERRFTPGGQLFREGAAEPLTIVEAEADQVGWRVRFAEVPDRQAAEELLGAYLEALIGPDEGLGGDEFYWHQVIGTRVLATDGTALGEVIDIYRAGGAEVLVVSGPDAAIGEIDVPMVKSVVRVFAPGSQIVVDTDALGLTHEATEEQPDER